MNMLARLPHELLTGGAGKELKWEAAGGRRGRGKRFKKSEYAGGKTYAEKRMLKECV